MVAHKNNKKPVVLFWEALPNVAGGQRVCLDVIRALRGRCEMVAIVPSKGEFSDAAEREGVKCVEIPFKSYSLVKKNVSDVLSFFTDTPSVVSKAVDIIKGMGVTAIYASSTRVFSWAAIAGRKASVPVIWHLHNILGDFKTKALVKILSNMKSVNLILSDSKSAALQYGKMAERVTVIYNGVDLTRFYPDKRKRVAFRDLCRIPQDAVVAGTVSDLIPHKGQITFIESMGKLCRDNPKLFGVIVGRARSGFEWYDEKLKSEIAKLGLDGRIVFTGYRKDVENVLNGMDILVVPSYSSESFPLIILEAFACGTVVVASAFSGMMEVINDGVSGFLFKTASSNELASKLALLAGDPQLLQKMGQYVEEEAKNLYDMEIFNASVRKSFAPFIQPAE
ncbi:MAG: glycosyltransferase family 4 protein [Candidatus Schekmanbacteria bacterium]|nr:glycosyltransferase family 4 protein [Candidatus Schekmanbacteria bacterium]